MTRPQRYHPKANNSRRCALCHKRFDGEKWELVCNTCLNTWLVTSPECCSLCKLHPMSYACPATPCKCKAHEKVMT